MKHERVKSGAGGCLMKCPAPLDPEFQPWAPARRWYRVALQRDPGRCPAVIAVERSGGGVSHMRCDVVADEHSPFAGESLRQVERMVKFLLWSRGGFNVYISGPAWMGRHIRADYGATGIRAFDANIMSRIYQRPFEVAWVSDDAIPAVREMAVALGGHWDGCRIGFDLGASDYKIAAVRDGEPVFSTELPWDPKNQANAEYHITKIREGLKLAAAHLPRVDAIGGSSAGVFVNNQPRVASLFRSIPQVEFASKVVPMFQRLEQEWGVPLVVINDGEVTALAGAMSLGVNGVLGIAMGSSEAAGYVTRQGTLTDWLNELAFAPVDFNPAAPVEEWSGDRGVGALYFSQQAVARLASRAGLQFPAELGVPERLKQVQKLADGGDQAALQIFETIGVYLGYTIPLYAELYEYEHLLILGRVTSGCGGELILNTATHVLRTEFPELADRVALHLPDEKSRRLGQAVAAASLPDLSERKGSVVS